MKNIFDLMKNCPKRLYNFLGYLLLALMTLGILCMIIGLKILAAIFFVLGATEIVGFGLLFIFSKVYYSFIDLKEGGYDGGFDCPDRYQLGRIFEIVSKYDENDSECKNYDLSTESGFRSYVRDNWTIKH